MRCIYQWSRRLIMFADYNIKSVIIWCCNICLEWRIRLYRFNVMLSLTVKSSRRAIKKLFIMKGFFCFYITHVYVSFERGRCGHILGLFYADNPRLCPHPRLYLNLCQHNIFIFFPTSARTQIITTNFFIHK